jgi:soluble lytic murein transglycosylase
VVAWLCAPAFGFSPDYELRRQYSAALSDLRAGRTSSFREKQAALKDYALYPYLQYYAARRQLDSLRPAEVRQFSQQWQDSPIADRLYRSWLANLAKRSDWQTYRDHYRPTTSAEGQCNYRRALHKTGDKQAALAAVEVLWTVPQSQPKACDWLFETWIDAGGLTQGMVWRRMGLALEARKQSLARYLQRYLEGEAKRLGELYYQVHRHPELVTERGRFKTDSAMVRDIVSHGLRRLAVDNPKMARKTWSSYRKRFDFSAEARRRVDDAIALRLARAGTLPDNLDLSPSPQRRAVIEAVILLAIEQGEWASATDYFQGLEADAQTSPKWQYGLARTEWEAASNDADREAAESTFAALAAPRHYYGFLAANHLGTAPALNAHATAPNPVVRLALLRRPAVARIRELFALGDIINARREWHFFHPTLTAEERITLAHMAADMGWTDQSIRAAANADLFDDLELRFPTPFRQLFLTESFASSVSISFLYGIARQESAFEPTAKSPAGAMGLMQLMPATASMTAKSLGKPKVTGTQLLHPDLNIHLGSRHLAELMERYDGNRALVAAAYNAGRHRVDRWLTERPARPLDLWVENIPFAETRNYVINVLAFSYIYGQKLGQGEPFLLAHEQ